MARLPKLAGTSNNRFLTTRYTRTGTKFRVYPQKGFNPQRRFKPEIVYIDAAPGAIKAGPEDDRIYVVNAKDKIPYHKSGELPPYIGARGPRATPTKGHFDRIKPKDKTFASATIFATIRCVLTIWEHYLGRKVRWYFRETYPRLEVIPRVLVKRNAISRNGYIECGFADLEKRSGPLCENFDVVAHEVGHAILKDVIGNPSYRTLEFRAHEEASADLIALVAALHFESVVDRVLDETKGYLFSYNILSRLAELSKKDELRELFNDASMSNLPWDPDPDTYKYSLALPFTGGAYDVLVAIYQDYLVSRNAIPKDLAEDSFKRRPKKIPAVKTRFTRRFKKNPDMFKEALLDARDRFAKLLARSWETTPVQEVEFRRVVEKMLEADRELNAGVYGSHIRRSFQRRKILPLGSQ